MTDERTYILGSDMGELQRLQFQHKVWSKEAFALWDRSGVTLNSRVLDLGCGPGFASFDLAAIVGPKGWLTGVDITGEYIDHAKRIAEEFGYNQAEFIRSDFEAMKLENATYDFCYSRWVFSWLKETRPVVEKVYQSLKPGGKFLLQEYVNWGTLQVFPGRKEVSRVIEACRRSWEIMPSEINIAPQLVEELKHAGFKVVDIKPLPKVGRAKDLAWQWPGTFLDIYSLKLIDMGLLTHEERNAFIPVWKELEEAPDSFYVGPLMLEIIAERV